MSFYVIHNSLPPSPTFSFISKITTSLRINLPEEVAQHPEKLQIWFLDDQLEAQRTKQSDPTYIYNRTKASPWNFQ